MRKVLPVFLVFSVFFGCFFTGCSGEQPAPVPASPSSPVAPQTDTDSETASPSPQVPANVPESNDTTDGVPGPDVSPPSPSPSDEYEKPISEKPSADFVCDQIEGYTPLVVDFTDTSTGTVTKRTWYFGDGINSSELNPSHNYKIPGTYTIRLVVEGPQGTDELKLEDYIKVLSHEPAANFSGSPLSGEFPLTVNFTDLSTGDIDTWIWSFGDGKTSNSQNPAHTYSEAGKYSVKLLVKGPLGSDVLQISECVDVAYHKPVADFRMSPLSGEVPLAVDFTNLSTGSIENWMWEFGDGGVSDKKSPSHLYNTPGVYTVELTVTGPVGSDKKIMEDCIQVTEPVYILTTDVRVKDSATKSCGIIELSPPGGLYEPNTRVKITAIPEEGYEFHYWSADASNCSEATCSIYMSEDKEIVAYFRKK